MTPAIAPPEVEQRYTSAEYACLPDQGAPTELIRGRVVRMNVPAPRHGQICSKIDRILGSYVEEHHLGHLVVGDAGILTERDPDTVRGGDVAYFSYFRIPPGPFPQGYLDVVPELVFEVRSPPDRWSQMLARASEYLEAGVLVVCLVDQRSETVHVYRAEEEPRRLYGDEELHLPDLLGEFRVPVRRFFE